MAFSCSQASMALSTSSFKTTVPKSSGCWPVMIRSSSSLKYSAARGMAYVVRCNVVVIAGSLLSWSIGGGDRRRHGSPHGHLADADDKVAVFLPAFAHTRAPGEFALHGDEVLRTQQATGLGALAPRGAGHIEREGGAGPGG